MNAPQKNNHRRWWWSRTGMALIAFLAIAGFFLITEHKAHLFGILPYALLLTSLLLYLFIRRGQGGDDAHDDNQPEDRK